MHETCTSEGTHSAALKHHHEAITKMFDYLASGFPDATMEAPEEFVSKDIPLVITEAREASGRCGEITKEHRNG